MTRWGLKDRFSNLYAVDPETTCWIWCGAKNPDGYGRFSIGGGSRWQYAHRVAFEMEYGPIQPGLVIDHICRNHACVNPVHLRAVTPRENVCDKNSVAPAALNTRKTHCAMGHEYTADNTYVRKNGGRECKACGLIRSAKYEQTHPNRKRKEIPA